jgi:hypothetical protein
MAFSPRNTSPERGITSQRDCPTQSISGQAWEPCPRLRVVAVVPFDEQDESPFVGLLQVEPA